MVSSGCNQTYRHSTTPPPLHHSTTPPLHHLILPSFRRSNWQMWLRSLSSCLVFLLLFSPLFARVAGFEVTAREDLLGGKPFGLAGPYEKISGRILYAIDPGHPANRRVADIDNAPTNQEGEVEFSADFFLLKPKQIRRGNRAVFFEVSNRGGKALLVYFNRASRSGQFTSEAEIGDGFLMRHGYTVLWLGWQFDTPRIDGRIRLYPPIARQKNRPIRGLVRCDFVVTKPVQDHLLSDRNHIPYATADPAASENVMTVRDDVESERREIPRSRWKFARFRDGRLSPDASHVALEGGFEPGKIYEVVYLSENPPLVGLGMVAVRDMLSHLKNHSSEALSIPRGTIDRAFGFGSSQSGRFLRTYLYHGLNQDEEGRPAFDGVIPHVAGAGRGSFNHRFAQPSRDAQPYANFFYPTDIFPFTDVEQTDPDTGITDGLLTHSPDAQFQPKIFYTNSSYEYFGRAASLTHTTVDGRRDAPMQDNVRMYVVAGSQHGPGPFPPTISRGQQPSNPMDYRWSLRALLKALDRWVTSGTPPPPSRYPRLDRKTLVPFEKLSFPQLPGISFPERIHKAYRIDFGPRFRGEGIVTLQPPRVGAAFPILVPAVDEDGNEIDGIRLPELAVPLATYTGWNLFNDSSGPTNRLSSFQGCYIPFPRTEQERQRLGDSRRPISARYQSRAAYVGLVTNEALALATQGYVLSEDIPQIVTQARRHWDHLVSADGTR